MSSLELPLKEFGMILDRFLRGIASQEQTVSTVRARFWDQVDDLEPRTQTEKLFVRAFWSVILLEESQQYATKLEELRYLRDCLVGLLAYDEQKANECYGPRSA